jgi:hypothetical protein
MAFSPNLEEFTVIYRHVSGRYPFEGALNPKMRSYEGIFAPTWGINDEVALNSPNVTL